MFHEISIFICQTRWRSAPVSTGGKEIPRFWHTVGTGEHIFDVPEAQHEVTKVLTAKLTKFFGVIKTYSDNVSQENKVF